MKTDASSAERSLTSGHLVVTMPLVNLRAPFKPKNFPDYYVTAKPKVEAAPPVDIHNIATTEEPSTEPLETRPQEKKQPPSWTEDDVPKLE